MIVRAGDAHPNSLLWKLLAAPCISALCFLGYLGYTLVVFSQNNQRLELIQKTQFPMLVLATNNVTALDKIVESFIAAVTTNEREPMESARRTADAIRADYAQLVQQTPERSAELARLRSEFETYFAAGTTLSEAFLARQTDRQDALTARMASALRRYQTDVRRFRDTADRQFRATVAVATRDSNRAMLSGVIIAMTGLAASLSFGLYVALAIKRQVDSVVLSFKDIAHGSGDLSQQIKVSSTDEMGELVHWFNTFVDKLRVTVAARSLAEDHLRQLAAELTRHRDQLEELVKERTQDLIAALAAAENASRAKSTFLANISHEIRTPLNAILGFSQLIGEMHHDKRTRDQVSKVIAAGDHLLGIINNVLDVSKIEAGKLTLDRSDFSLHTIFDHIYSMVSATLKAKSLSWQATIDPALPPALHGDRGRISQIVLNFVANAVKFTLAGQITLSARLMNRHDNAVDVRIEVQDTGPGIDSDQRERLFEAFEQADDSTTRRFGGTGLGLAISRRLAQLMDGEVGVHDAPGGGSVFWMTLPLASARTDLTASESDSPDAGAAARRLIASRHAGARILVAEDNVVNQEVIRAFLEGCGLEIHMVSTGREAVDLLSRERCDLILMDVQMPELDGLEATRLIRMQPGGNAIPIVALTANVFAEDVARCRQAGMDDHLGKPVNLQTLYDAFLKWLAASRSRRHDDRSIGARSA